MLFFPHRYWQEGNVQNFSESRCPWCAVKMNDHRLTLLRYPRLRCHRSESKGGPRSPTCKVEGSYDLRTRKHRLRSTPYLACGPAVPSDPPCKRKPLKSALSAHTSHVREVNHPPCRREQDGKEGQPEYDLENARGTPSSDKPTVTNAEPNDPSLPQRSRRDFSANGKPEATDRSSTPRGCGAPGESKSRRYSAAAQHAHGHF